MVFVIVWMDDGLT